MESILFSEGILNFNGGYYDLVGIISDPGQAVLVSLKNEQYEFTIALTANETTINGVLQTSSEMIVETLSS
jgi:hypothetical protein